MKKLLLLGALAMNLNAADKLFALAPKLPPLEPVDFRPPAADRRVLANGLVVYLMQDPSLPMVRLTALVRTGKMYDPAGRTGLGEMAADLLKDGGTLKYSSEELDKKLEFLGASVETSIGNEEARADMHALAKDLDEVLDIYAQVLTAPAFEAAKVKVKRDELLEVISRRYDDPGRAAVREAVRRFYGPDHPYGWRMEKETVGAVAEADLRAWHSNYFRPNNTILVAAGDFGPADAMLAKLEKAFGGWERAEVKFPAIPPVKLAGRRQVFHLEKDAQQAFIVMLQRGVKRLDPAEYPLTVANEMLGGGLSSRLASEIRSRKGLAYTVYSAFSKKPDYGYIMGYVGTKPETYSQALEEMIRQFDLMKAGLPPADETDRAKDSIVNSFVFKFPTPFELLAERASYEYYGYAPDYLDNYVENVSKVGPAQVLETARRLYNPADSLIFVIGNSKKFDKPLSEFGEVIAVAED